jgi:hypothetical protein
VPYRCCRLLLPGFSSEARDAMKRASEYPVTGGDIFALKEHGWFDKCTLTQGISSQSAE